MSRYFRKCENLPVPTASESSSNTPSSSLTARFGGFAQRSRRPGYKFRVTRWLGNLPRIELRRHEFGPFYRTVQAIIPWSDSNPEDKIADLILWGKRELITRERDTRDRAEQWSSLTYRGPR